MVGNPITARILDYWRDHRCPFCGNLPGDMMALTILSTTSLSCEVCGEVVESWELYQDTTGRYFTENHLRSLGRDRDKGIGGWERLAW